MGYISMESVRNPFQYFGWEEREGDENLYEKYAMLMDKQNRPPNVKIEVDETDFI